MIYTLLGPLALGASDKNSIHCTYLMKTRKLHNSCKNTLHFLCITKNYSTVENKPSRLR